MKQGFITEERATRMKNLPVIKFIIWALNSRKVQVAVLGVLATFCVKYLGVDVVEATRLSELIFWSTLGLIGGITGEDMANKVKGGQDEEATGGGSS